MKSFFEKKSLQLLKCLCRSIPAKPTCIRKEKDIPRLPEIQKKLYQYFRLFYFHSHNNIAVISLLSHVVDTYQIRITPQYIFIQSLRTFYVALWDGMSTWRARTYSKLGMNILLRAVYVATELVTSQNFHSNPLCCCAVSLWSDTCRLRSHQN